MLLPFAAAFAEEILEERAGFVFFDTGHDFHRVVQAFRRGYREDRAGAAGAFVPGAEHQSLDSRQHNRAGAHGTGFLGHEHDRTFQSPVAQHAGSLRDCQYLGMGCGILQEFDLIEGAGDNGSLVDDDGADRNFADVIGQARLPQGFAHETVVAGEIDCLVFRLERFDHWGETNGWTGGGQERFMDAPGNNSGIADLSPGRARLRITGADRVAFLHGQCTNDVKKLAAGESCYAAFLNPKGKMRGDGHILCLEDAFLVEASHGLLISLEKFIITEDVILEDVSGRLGAWIVVGGINAVLPAGALLFAHALGTGVISAMPMTATLSREELEAIRIEAGVPCWGVDMDEDTIPVEAGLETRAISYDKGCYVGQETIARIKTYGHVNRHLVQMACQSQAGMPVPQVPSRGEKIFVGDREVGWVTSAVDSMRLGKRLALGYLRREFAATGTKLKINQQVMEVLKICGA